MDLTEKDWQNPFVFNLLGTVDDAIGNKNWITPTLCIGNALSSYEHFQVVVNANFPNNHIPSKKIGRREEKMDQSNCTLYLVGLCDHDSENLNRYLDHLIPRLERKYNENPSATFLFHCYAGHSRSVALALAFMVEVMKIKLDEAYQLVQEKRRVKLRPFFLETLQKRYAD